MKDPEDLSQVDKILLATAALSRETGGLTFTAEEIAVRAWKEWKRTFGLRGYEELYPDSRKVYCAFMGSDRGPVHAGLLRKAGTMEYELTPAGQVYAGELVGSAPAKPANNTANGNGGGLPPGLKRFALHVLNTRAVQLFAVNRKTEATFAHACELWELPDGACGEAVDVHLREFASRLRALEAALGGEDAHAPGCVLPTGRALVPGDARAVLNIHASLLGRFDKLLHLMRTRKIPATSRRA